MPSSSKIKVCGLLNPIELMRADAKLNLDYIGLIFYEKSPRSFQLNGPIPKTKAQQVGVFVDESKAFIEKKMSECRLDIFQLHGNESPELCADLRILRPVFKAISIKDESSLKGLEKYIDCVDTFVFDTATPKKGGSGEKFSWDLLKKYDLPIPFLLSGGIGPEDTKSIQAFSHPMCIGLDLNSRFETSPGLKDFNLLKNFINEQS